MTTQHPQAESMLDHCFFATCRELEHLEALLNNAAYRGANAQLQSVEAALGHYLRVAIPHGTADHGAQALFASLMVRLRGALSKHPELHAAAACADLREQLADDRRARAPLHLESSELAPAPAPAMSPVAPRSIPTQSSLSEPHRQMERILADVEFLVARRSFSAAAARFGELRRGLEAHMDEEEESLFPNYVTRVGDRDGLIAAACSAHNHLRVLLDLVSASISQSDHAAFVSRVGELDEAISAHNAEEERTLHGELERVLALPKPATPVGLHA